MSAPPQPTCPQGHASDDADWCDVCGLAMAPPAAAAATPATPPTPAACPACGADLEGRFCETCGQDSMAPVPDPAAPTPAAPTPAAPTPAAPAPTWHAVVRVDRGWFDEVCRRNGVDTATLEFPRYAPERRFVLTGAQMAIGRRSASRGTSPEIDLTGLDPGVSTTHAVLVARPDGGWELVDVGSMNGTTLALPDGPITAHRPVPLADGAVIHLGAWTTITLAATP